MSQIGNNLRHLAIVPRLAPEAAHHCRDRSTIRDIFIAILCKNIMMLCVFTAFPPGALKLIRSLFVSISGGSELVMPRDGLVQ